MRARAGLLLVLFGTFGLSTTGAVAEMLATKADLRASSEVPPNDSTATGTVEVSLDTDTRLLTWTVTYSGLTGSAIGAHFHGPTEAGKNGGIAVPFGSLASPIKGTATVTATQVADLRAGRWYVNIHTERHPGGEVRAQVLFK